MPRNRVSNDVDHVVPDPKPSNPPESHPLSPGRCQTYEPTYIEQPFRTGVYSLPSKISIDSPFAIFNLFFNSSIFKTVTKYTNKYAALYQPDPIEFPKHRP